MIRVAHLLPNMVTGGRERIVADLCRHSIDVGISPSLVLYDPEAEGRQIDAGDVPRHTLDRRRPDFTEALRALLARERIDVLHAQGHVAAALAVPVAGRVPIVTSLHMALGSGWRWAPAIARGLRASGAVTAVSADLARRFHWLSGREIDVVLPGIDISAHHVEQRRANIGFTIGIAARLHPVKRHRDAIEALRMLHSRGVTVRLEIAGQGGLDAELRARAAGLDVTFHGDVADMPGWLAGLDAFLLCSDHEGIPLALIEACASGLPCIATAVGGIPETFGAAVLTVPKRRPGAIAAAIERLSNAPTACKLLGQSSLALAPMFALDRMIARYQAIYSDVLIKN